MNEMNVLSNGDLGAIGIGVSAPVFGTRTRMDKSREATRNGKIVIIDDEDLVISVVRRFLQSEGYVHFETVNDSTQALAAIRASKPDLILLDITMPVVSGLEILDACKTDPALQQIPVIILSANQEKATQKTALELGAMDFIAKPVDRSELILRVQNAMMLKQHFDAISNHARLLEQEVEQRTRQLERSREQVLQCLARAAEYRDNETGRHVVRVGKYCRAISEQLQLPTEFCRQIELSAQLHDLGKIGIPDSLLLSSEKLTPEQFEVMKKHCEIGRAILNPFAAEEIELLRRYQQGTIDLPVSLRSPMLSLAARIAQTHHEKFDGTGYPLGLKGEQIPLEGRITAVADVYDALCSVRPYKPGFTVEKSLEIMLAERGTRFDPVVLDAFFEKISTIEKIRLSLQDQPPSPRSASFDSATGTPFAGPGPLKTGQG